MKATPAVSALLLVLAVSAARAVVPGDDYWQPWTPDGVGRPAVSAIYAYRLCAGKQTRSKKLVLLKRSD